MEYEIGSHSKSMGQKWTKAMIHIPLICSYSECAPEIVAFEKAQHLATTNGTTLPTPVGPTPAEVGLIPVLLWVLAILGSTESGPA